MARNKLSFSSSKEMKYYFLHVQRHRLNYPPSRDCGTFPREIRTQKQTHANYGEYFEKYARISIEMVMWIISCIFAYFLDVFLKSNKDYSLKKWETLDYVLCFSLHFFRALAASCGL